MIVEPNARVRFRTGAPLRPPASESADLALLGASSASATLFELALGRAELWLPSEAKQIACVQIGPRSATAERSPPSAPLLLIPVLETAFSALFQFATTERPPSQAMFPAFESVLASVSNNWKQRD
jgi:hypothetical protein